MRNILVSILICISFSIFAQTGEKNFIDQNYIEVNGTADMEIVPDQIFLKIVLNEKELKNDKGLIDVEKKMIDELTQIGIDIKKDLTIKDFESNFKFHLIGSTDVLLVKEYELLVYDAKTLQRVFLNLKKNGISNINVDRVDHTKIEEFRKEVKINAVKAAKDKAEALSSAINQNIGRALYIQELDYSGLRIYKTASNMQIRGVSSDNANELYVPEIEFQKIPLKYSVLVRFELK